MFNYKQICSVIMLVILFSGCSTWQNFTTYFNVYYNAKLNYDEAMEDIAKNQKDIFEFKENQVSANADKALTKVIEKCSAILQFNAESNYFDDALLIIGIAYYYKQNYSKALRKFRELEAVKETDLSLENKLWIGKTELQLRNFEEGINQLEEVKMLAVEEENLEILEVAYQTQIAFYFFQENYEQAVAIINDFLEKSENEESKAEVAFQLGKIYLELDDIENAIQAFSSVPDYNPSTRTEFQSKLELTKVKLMLDEYDESLAILDELKEEDKFNPYSDLITYHKGLTYMEQKELDKAIENFLIVDTMKVLSEKETAGLARMQLGELWEYDYMDYDSAAKYYNKAASSILTPDEKSYVISKITLFKNYKNLNKNISKNEKQLIYINEPEEFVKDSIDYVDYLFELKQDSLDNQGEDRVTENAENRRAKRNNVNSIQSGQLNERRLKPVRPVLTSDSLVTLLSQDKYDLGNMFFIELEVPDSAYYYYNYVLENYPDRPFTPNIEFALGSYYLSIDDTLKSDSVFQYIYDQYQGLKVAEQAARRLGLLEFDVAADTSAQFFLDAENKYLDENYNEAIQKYFELADRFPESILAPKALYTAGWILENDLANYDSAAVVFDTLNTRYEKSLYAKEIQPKLFTYKNEQKRIKAELDKEKAEAESDSTNSKPDIEEAKLPESPEDPEKLLEGDEAPVKQVQKNKTPEELRKLRFLKAEQEKFLKDSSNTEIDKPAVIELEDTPDSSTAPDSSAIPDSLNKRIEPLLK